VRLSLCKETEFDFLKGNESSSADDRSGLAFSGGDVYSRGNGDSEGGRIKEEELCPAFTSTCGCSMETRLCREGSRKNKETTIVIQVTVPK
jgi:hypothetical protein